MLPKIVPVRVTGGRLKRAIVSHVMLLKVKTAVSQAFLRVCTWPLDRLRRAECGLRPDFDYSYRGCSSFRYHRSAPIAQLVRAHASHA